MNSFKKTLYLFMIILLILGVGIGFSFAQDEDIITLPPESFVIQDSPTDGATVKFLKNWTHGLSSTYDCVTEVKAGEWINGAYRVYLNKDATIKRIYKIDQYGLKDKFNSPISGGYTLFSWGFAIPNNTAKNGDTPKFSCTYNVAGGNKITRSMKFLVRRDAVFNSNRAFMDPMNAAIKSKIIDRVKDARKYLKKCELEYNAVYIKYSQDAYQFMTDMNTWRPHAVLIHSHGSADDGGRIYLRDESYINATNLSGYDFTAPAGLFYAAICEGAATDTLGNAFVNAGYDAFIGYVVSVYTTRNADFYRYFFKKAKRLDRSVAQALSMAIAWASGKGWTDVATARIIGNGGDLFLGGTSTDGPATIEEIPTEFEPMNTLIAPWRDISTMVLTAAEGNAVAIANQTAAVKSLMATDGDDLVTGIEEFTDVYRVSYKRKNVFVYGVDVDKESGKVVYQGFLD